MKIITDKEGKEVIVRLCDIGLKATGLQGIETISKVLQALKEGEKEPHNEIPEV